jgi:hypothetical protein
MESRRRAPPLIRNVSPTRFKAESTVPTRANWFIPSEGQHPELTRCVKLPGGGLSAVASSQLPRSFPTEDRFGGRSFAPTSAGGAYLAFSLDRVNDSAKRSTSNQLVLSSIRRAQVLPGSFYITATGLVAPSPTRSGSEAARLADRRVLPRLCRDRLSEGGLDRLPNGHRGAFDAVVTEVRTRIEGRHK